MEPNQTSPSRSKPKNIYARGADDGALLGVYIIVLFVLMIAAAANPYLAVPSVAMMLGVPCLVYYFLRRTHRAAHGLTTFSALWMQGIVMFACASLIFGVASYVYIHWINPAFIHDMLATAIEYYRSAPQTGEQIALMADEMEGALRHNTLPTAAHMVLSWMWLIVFSGSLLSMLAAGAARLMRVPPANV